jgi:hypothetical protein
MDHLDVGPLRRLRRDVTVVTAAAMADLLTPMRFRDVAEMGWGESKAFDTSHGGLSIEAFRVQHWGARLRHDVHRGFNGYMLERQGRRICIAGDTKRTSFTEVGRKPTDVMVVPIGAYNPGLPVTAHPSRPWKWPIRLAPSLSSPCIIRRSVSAGSRWMNRFNGLRARCQGRVSPFRTSARPSYYQALPLWTGRAGVQPRQRSSEDISAGRWRLHPIDGLPAIVQDMLCAPHVSRLARRHSLWFSERCASSRARECAGWRPRRAAWPSCIAARSPETRRRAALHR